MAILNTKSTTKLAILALITILVFFALIKAFGIDIDEIKRLIYGVELKFLLVGIIVFLFGAPLAVWRWQNTLLIFGYKIKFKRILIVGLANGLFMLIPGRLGDLARAYSLKNEVPINKSVKSIILEKIIDVLSLLIMTAVGALIIGQFLWFWLALSAAAIIAAGIFILMHLNNKLSGLIRSDRIKNIIKYLPDIVSAALENKAIYIRAQVVSFLNWSTNVGMVYFFFLAFDSSVPLISITAILPISIFAGLVPITLAGMGTRDAVMLNLFSSYASSSQILGVGIMYSLITGWLGVIVGLFFAHKIKPPNLPADGFPRN